MMKNYQLALSCVADSSAAAFAFTMPKTVADWAQLIFLGLSLISLILGFIIKVHAIVEARKEKRISNAGAVVEVVREAQDKVDEAKKILSDFSRKGKYRVEGK